MSLTNVILKDHTFIKTQDDTLGCGNPIARNLMMAQRGKKKRALYYVAVNLLPNSECQMLSPQERHKRRVQARFTAGWF